MTTSQRTQQQPQPAVLSPSAIRVWRGRNLGIQECLWSCLGGSSPGSLALYQHASSFVDLLQNVGMLLMRNSRGGGPVFGLLSRINHRMVRQRKIQAALEHSLKKRRTAAQRRGKEQRSLDKFVKSGVHCLYHCSRGKTLSSSPCGRTFQEIPHSRLQRVNSDIFIAVVTYGATSPVDEDERCSTLPAPTP